MGRDWRGLQRSGLDWRRFEEGVFPITGCTDHQITRSFTTLCLRPSARPPPPIALLLQTKIKVPFDRAVDRAVEALFRVFPMPNRVSFNLSFVLLSKTCRQTHFDQQRNVVIYHLFAIDVKQKRVRFDLKAAV
jgi:hypothetical protein